MPLTLRHALHLVNRLLNTVCSSCIEIPSTARQLYESHTAVPVGLCTVHCITLVPVRMNKLPLTVAWSTV